MIAWQGPTTLWQRIQQYFLLSTFQAFMLPAVPALPQLLLSSSGMMLAAVSGQGWVV